MSEKLGHLNISAFEPFPQELLTPPPTPEQVRSGFMIGGSGNTGRQNVNLGYTTKNGTQLKTAFGTNRGRDNTLQSVSAEMPINDRMRLALGYQPVAGNMGQEQVGAQLKYRF